MNWKPLPIPHGAHRNETRYKIVKYLRTIAFRRAKDSSERLCHSLLRLFIVSVTDQD